jgi:general secretion pathway protein A
MYYEYWGMNRHPFDNVPDPTMYFRAHTSVETAVGEVLFAIEEGDEVLAVIVGEVGLGKTTSLRVILDSLDPAKYRIAFITNPDVTFTMLMRDIVGQLKGETCESHRKDDLLEEFNRLLFTTADEGKKVLVFIDEGNAFKPMNLESLRLLTNMQEDNRNLFTIVLAGQPKLAKMLEAPSRANLFQRIGVYCHLEKMESWHMAKDYIDHRLERAGTTRPIFSDDAVKAVYEYSENGVPRLVNKICKLALKAGETNALAQITPELVAAIGERFRRFTRAEKKADGPADAPSDRAKKPRKSRTKTLPDATTNGGSEAPIETVPVPAFVSAEESAAEPEPALTLDSTGDAGAAATPDVGASEGVGDVGGDGEHIEHGFSASAAYQKQILKETDNVSGYDEKGSAADELHVDGDGPQTPEKVCVDEALRPDVLEKARHADRVERMKMAGQLAAEEIKKHPEVVSHVSDPVEMWKELRDDILSAFMAEVNS